MDVLNGFFFFCLLEISTNICFFRRILRINDVHGNIIAIVIPSMDESIKAQLVDRLAVLFPDIFIFTNSAAMGIDSVFPCSHYVYYNRYAVQVFFFTFTFCFICLTTVYSRQRMRIILKNQLNIKGREKEE